MSLDQIQQLASASLRDVDDEDMSDDDIDEDDLLVCYLYLSLNTLPVFIYQTIL